MKSETKTKSNAKSMEAWAEKPTLFILRKNTKSEARASMDNKIHGIKFFFFCVKGGKRVYKYSYCIFFDNSTRIDGGGCDFFIKIA